MNEYGLKQNNVKVVINADLIEESAKQQIEVLSRHPAFKGLISIMPDVHLGKGSVIGFTGKFDDNLVIPNVIGVDIGCGISCYRLGKVNIDFEKLDKNIRKNIPLGFKSHNGTGYSYNISQDLWNKIKINCGLCEEFLKSNGLKGSPFNQIGTLGGGNHFIEIAKDENENLYLLVHTGSRNFGKQVCDFYQQLAKDYCNEFKIVVPEALEYLPLNLGGEAYFQNMFIAQEFASLNRRTITSLILYELNLKFDNENYFESVHNYVNQADMIIRKGAISASKYDELIIPFNMSEGSIIGYGKSNAKYNNSAPHGSGRTHGRKDMQRLLASGQITMEEFNKRMKDTIDESPMAYKQFNDIKKHLEETVEIQHKLKPVYNLKEGGE
jgi:tRNA-splicing ligase RtcB